MWGNGLPICPGRLGMDTWLKGGGGGREGGREGGGAEE